MTSPEQGNSVHPRILAEQLEAESQANILETQACMSAWDQRLQNAAEADLSKEDRFKLSTEAVLDVDKNWLYKGHKFFVAGKWILPAVTLNADQEDDGSITITGFDISDTKEDVLDTQWSKGVGVRTIDGKPRLGFVFTADSDSVTLPFLDAQFVPQAFALPEEVSLTLMDIPSQEQNQAHTERIIECLELYDRLLDLYVSSEVFLTQTRSQQERTIRKLIQGANELITAPGVLIYVACTTSDIYARTEISTGYGFQHLNSAESEDGQMIELEGVVRGVGFLEQALLAEMALHKDSDFIDRSAGLCLIMEVENEYGPHLLYVPYQSTIIEDGGLNVLQSDF